LASTTAAELGAALQRNLYGTVEIPPSPAIIDAMAAYVRRQDALLGSQDEMGLLSGSVSFGGVTA
jgi:hypothetical protein